MRRMDDTHCGPEMPSLSKLTLLSELDGLLVSEALLRKVLIRRADFPEKQWFLGRPVPLFSPNSKSVPEPPASRASAPPPARTESHGYALHWQRPPVRAEGDGVTVVPQGWGRGVRLVVTSSAGVGQVEVRPVRGVWPHRVQVEFEYAAGRPFDVLEGVRFQVVNPAHTAGDEVPPLPPDGFSIWQRDGRFWVALPEGWLERQQTLRIGWVDRYRR